MEKRFCAKEVQFPQQISPTEWAVYHSALNAVRTANVRFVLGGAFALAVYTGRWRDTKDLDLLILQQDRDAIIDALNKAGFEDYFNTMAYDRGWIYRSTRDGFIVDLIWCMANRRAYVDEGWFENATAVRVHTELLYAVPPEELLWHKLYVLQRERCDWPDILNLLNGVGGCLDWDRLMERLEHDELLLNGALQVFAWLCPAQVREFPKWVRKKFNLPNPGRGAPVTDINRINWLDTRPWFVPHRELLKKK